MAKEWKSTIIKDSNNKFCSGTWYWDPRYMLCLKTEFPKTKTVTFKRKKSMVGKKIDWQNPTFYDEDNDESNRNGYRVPCRGDSGSGQVFLTNIKKDIINVKDDFRYALAAVYNGDVTDEFPDPEGNRYIGPCGMYAWREDQKRFLSTTGHGHAQ